MSLAFNWRPSCELPIKRIEQNEGEQIVETMLSKMAKKHHIENYVRLTSVFGEQLDYQGIFFTADDGVGHPATKPGGLLENITAQDYEQVSISENGIEIYDLFTHEVSIEPHSAVFNSMHLLMP